MVLRRLIPYLALLFSLSLSSHVYALAVGEEFYFAQIERSREFHPYEQPSIVVSTLQGTTDNMFDSELYRQSANFTRVGAAARYGLRYGGSSYINLDANAGFERFSDGDAGSHAHYRFESSSYSRLGSKSSFRTQIATERTTRPRHLDNFLNNERRDVSDRKYIKGAFALGRARSKGFLALSADHLQLRYLNNRYSSTNLSDQDRNTSRLKGAFQYRLARRTFLEATLVWTHNEYPSSNRIAYDSAKLLFGGSWVSGHKLRVTALAGIDRLSDDESESQITAFNLRVRWQPSIRFDNRLELLQRFDTQADGDIVRTQQFFARFKYFYNQKITLGGNLKLTWLEENAEDVYRSTVGLQVGYRYNRLLSFGLQSSLLNNELSASDELFDRASIQAAIYLSLM